MSSWGDGTGPRPDGTGGMRVDLVAAPTRYPRGPLVLLLLIAVVPAIGLLVLYRWADAEAQEQERAADGEEVADDLLVAERSPAAAPELTTAVLDVRRAARSIAGQARLERLRAETEPLFDLVGGRSCAAVSVGGRDAGSVNADVPVIPGSVQKLVVAAVALEVLGPGHRFTTTVAAPPPVDGVVEGDLFIVGGGDPLLTADDYPVEEDSQPVTSPTSLDRLADAIVAEGVVYIAGAVVGDGTRYDDELVVDTWADGVAFVDAGPYDALMVNDSRALFASGRQSDPNSAGARELVRLLNARGVTVEQGWTSGAAPPDVPVMARVRSARLPRVLEEMLVTSDNNTAEMLVKEIGFADRGEGTRVAGLNVIDRTLRAWDVPVDGVRIIDGSGLSPGNRATCAALLAVLQREAGGRLPGLLPVAGRTGTLADELVGSPIAGRLRAKTGTLGNPPVEEAPPAVRSLAGYVVTPRAPNLDPVEMVLVLNGPDIDAPERYQPVWAELGERLATYPSGPTAAELGPR